MAKILIVEDNKLNLKLFKDLLTTKKHEIITSEDGNNIKEILSLQKPQIILMDIQLGRVSGLDLIKIVKNDNDTKHIPIIAITAFAMQTDQTLISNSGCDMYITKPVSIDKFFEAIDSFL